MEVKGSLKAVTKSFTIPHPTKPGKRLVYVSLEGPENGVYIRGKLYNSDTIDLPDYWSALIDYDSITVSLTPIEYPQDLYVKRIDKANNQIIVGTGNSDDFPIRCFYHVFAERKDIPKLEVEQ